MNILSMFAAPINKIIDSVGNAVDKLVTSDEERIALKNELISAKLAAEREAKELELDFEKELSSRHALDMKSDDVWSKRIRPGSLIYLLIVVTMLALTDGNIGWGEYLFQIKDSYISLFEGLLMLAFGFYFGSRGVEKVMKIWKDGK